MPVAKRSAVKPEGDFSDNKHPFVPSSTIQNDLSDGNMVLYGVQ